MVHLKLSPKVNQMKFLKTTESSPASHESAYSEEWYAEQVNDALRSAREVVPYLWKIFLPQTVSDIGCGRGAWLKAWLECGVKTAIGYDGSWNNQQKMLDNRINFISINLDKLISNPKKTDLAVSLEVAEHLSPHISEAFIHFLTEISDVVVFSAAFENQGGVCHINERRHTHWNKLFSMQDFDCYDLVRPHFWNNPNVSWWYKQNTFVYVKRSSVAQEMLANLGISSLNEQALQDAIHPDMYNYVFTKYLGIINSKTYRFANTLSLVKQKSFGYINRLMLTLGFAEK